MEEKVLEYIRRDGLIAPGERILLAVSGGPDSICLFHLLLRLCPELDCSLGVAHINHGLRGAESDDEERFVKDLAKQFELPFYGTYAAIPELSRQRGTGTEATARQVRYEFFEKIMKQEGYAKTALAHNLNDQAETILHRLIRGTGLNGLAGMRSIRDEVYIRPLLSIRRSAIEAWLTERGLEARIDSSNLTSEYTRNRIRLELMPKLEDFNPDILGALSNLSETLAMDRDYLEARATALMADHLTVRGTHVIIDKAAFTEPGALTSRFIFEAIRRLTGSRADITSGHIRDILKLQAGETGHQLDLPDRLVVYNHYGDLEFSRPQTATLLTEPVSEAETLLVDLSALPFATDFGPYRIKFSWEAGAEASGRLDAGRFAGKLILRRRREQDRMKMLGMTGYKKVKNIFIDKKIHRGARDKLPVITDQTGEIAFIYPGICGEAFRITENTDKIIYITVTEIEND